MYMAVAVALILLAGGVGAIGVAPARSTFEFSPDSVFEGKFRVIVDEVPAKILITAEGELGQYIELDKETLIVDQRETWINYKIRLPSDMYPGERAGGILAIEVPRDTSREKVVMATTAVMHQVRVNVPYPGKYLVGKFYITETQVNRDIMFTLAFANWGKEKIERARAIITIKGPTNEELAVIRTGEVSIEPNKETKLQATWKTEYEGAYYAEAVIEYDGKILEISEPFRVGDQSVEIETIEVRNFRLGQIAQLDILLRNKWNQPLNIDGRVEVYKNNKLISSFNAMPVTLQARSTSMMSGYWNTEKVEPGEYDALVKITYGGQTTERAFSSLVSVDSIQFRNMISGEVTKGKNVGGTTLLVIIVFVLIIVNILLFIYINKKLRSKN
jgi:hypothetical protein